MARRGCTERMHGREKRIEDRESRIAIRKSILDLQYRRRSLRHILTVSVVLRQLSPRVSGRLLVRESIDAGERLPFEQLQHGAAARRDVADGVSESGRRQRGH